MGGRQHRHYPIDDLHLRFQVIGRASCRLIDAVRARFVEAAPPIADTETLGGGSSARSPAGICVLRLLLVFVAA